MASKVLKEIIERVESWPEDRLENAARVLETMEELDADEFRVREEADQ